MIKQKEKHKKPPKRTPKTESIMKLVILSALTLRKKCPCSELFWSAFSCIWTEYGEILSISPYSVRLRENADQNNSEYGYFSSSIRKWSKLIACQKFNFEVIDLVIRMRKFPKN